MTAHIFGFQTRPITITAAHSTGIKTGIGVGDGEAGVTCPLKFGKKYFSGNYYVKFGHFQAKIM